MCFLIETVLKPVFIRLFGYLVTPTSAYQVQDSRLTAGMQMDWDTDFDIHGAYDENLDPDEKVEVSQIVGLPDMADMEVDPADDANSDNRVEIIRKWKLRNRRSPAKQHSPKKSCKCGNVLHIAKIRCEKCGLQKTPKTIDWRMMRQKAPKSAHVATKRVFHRICQLHAAHGRDVVVLIHNSDKQGRKFRVWGTPGAGERFLQSEIGDAIRDAWRFQVGVRKVQKKRKQNRKANGRISIEPFKTISDTTESIVKRIEESSKENDISISPQTDQTSDQDVYEVEEVMGMKLCEEDGILKYQIKWKGFSHDENTWEPEENIIDKSLLLPFRLCIDSPEVDTIPT